MGSKTIVLVTTVLLCFLGMSVAYPQVDTSRSAEDSQQSESPQLSLADLDALIEDDSDEDLRSAKFAARSHATKTRISIS